MSIEIGQIVNNLIPAEPVVISKIQSLGTKVSIAYTGVNTKKASTKEIAKDEFDRLQVLSTEGEFQLHGKPCKVHPFH